MILRLLVTLLLTATVANAGSPILDVPIVAKTADEAYAALSEIHKRLPESEARDFAVGVSGLCVEIDAGVSAELTEAERKAVIKTVVPGLTPRQMILIGAAMRVLRTKADLADAISESKANRDSWHPKHFKQHVQLEESMAVACFQKYSK